MLDPVHANRVTIYVVSSITDGQNAVNVLGQANFTVRTGAVTQTGMNTPTGLAFDATNNRLFVTDGNNNRVLVHSVSSITDGQNATNVLGQSDFTTLTATTTQTGMKAPVGLAFDSTNNRLFVTESGNHRVTTFDVCPTAFCAAQTSSTSYTTTESSVSTPSNGGGRGRSGPESRSPEAALLRTDLFRKRFERQHAQSKPPSLREPLMGTRRKGREEKRRERMEQRKQMRVK